MGSTSLLFCSVGTRYFNEERRRALLRGKLSPFKHPMMCIITLRQHPSILHLRMSVYELMNLLLHFPSILSFFIQKGFGFGFQEKKNQFMKARRLNVVTERIAANLKMMQAYQMCYSKFDQEYDLYLRIREDAGFRNTISPENYSPILNQSEAFLVPKRLRNGGINDRLAFVTGHESALCYFQLPFVQMFSGWMLDDAMTNTESKFKRLYWIHECPKGQAFPTKNNKLDPMKTFQGRFIEQ